MKSATHRALVALLVLSIVLGYAPTALAGTQIHVKIPKPANNLVDKVFAYVTIQPPKTVQLLDGDSSGNWKASDDGDFVSDDIYSITVTFDGGGSQTFYHPKSTQTPHFKLGNESQGTVNIELEGVAPPEPQLGSITVTKEIAHGSDTFEDGKLFTVTLNGPNNYASAKTVAAGGSVTFSGLAEGTYTVSEVNPGEGWTVTYSTQTVEVGADGVYDHAVTITNHYDAPKGTVTIYYKADGTGEDLAGPYTHEGKVGTVGTFYAITFDDYKLKDGQPTVYEHTYTEQAAEYTFWYVPSTTPQGVLQVYHKVHGSGYPLATDKYIQDVGSSITVDAREFEIYELMDGQNASFTYTFQEETGEHTFWYVLKKATVVISKSAGQDSDPFPTGAKFSVTLTSQTGSETYDSDALAVDSPVTFEVAPGAYTLSETDPGDEWADPVFDPATPLAFAAGQTYEITIYNTYRAPRSTLTVVHQVWGTDTVLRTDEPITMKVGETVTVEADDFAGYDLKDGEAASYVHTFGTSDATYTFWYVPEPETGSLTVWKILDEGDDYGTEAPTFKIGIRPAEAALAQADGETWPKYVELGLGEDHTFTDLEPGYYEVFEEDIPENWTWTWTDPEEGYVEVKAGEEAVAYIYNSYTAPETPEQFTLTIYYRNWNTEEQIKDPDEYTEEPSSEPFIYYAPVIPGYVLYEEESESSFSYTFEEDGEHTFWYLPEPEPETGSIQVTKLLGEGDPYQGNQEFTIGIMPAPQAVLASLETLEESDWPWTVNLKIDQSFTFEGLEPGLYVVFEDTDSLPDNWECLNPVEYVEVGPGGKAEVEIYNAYTAPEPPPPPPPPSTSMLTVYYREWGTNEDLHAPTTHTGIIGSSLVVNPFEVEGYELREGEPASYTHEFGSGNATYTFWYEMVIEDEEPPLAPTGGISATMMYGIGAALLGLGLATKKRGRNGRR